MSEFPSKAGMRIVAIGGSAGAYKTLETILRDLPAELPAAIFVVLHVQPSERNWLAQRLAQFSRWPVISPLDEAIRVGHVYTAIPDHHLLIKDERAINTRGPRENMWRPAIDVLFRSAAVAYSSRAIGVLLSGELDDGTSGLQAMKTCGGTTVIEEPATASHPAMPSVALANVAIDHRVAAPEIGTLVSRLIEQPTPPALSIPPALRQEVAMAEATSEITTAEIVSGAPSQLSCPECGGPLWSHDADHTSFRCLVGHAYRIGTLNAAVDLELDRTLWAAIRLFEQRANISQMMSDDARKRSMTKRAELHATRAKEAKQHVARLRELLSQMLPIDEAEWEAKASSRRTQ